MVSTLLLVVGIILVVVLVFTIIRKLFKLALLVGAVALGVWAGMWLMDRYG